MNMHNRQMGICIQKPSANFKGARVAKANYKQSFLYSSFTYDPSYTDQSNFFFFDLPHYCEIQYILRKSLPQQSPQLEANIEQHVEEIQSALNKLRNQNFVPGSKLTQPVSFKKTQQKTYETDGKIEQQQEHSTTKHLLDTEQFNNTLNLQVFSVTLEECQNIQELPFKISLNGKQIITIMGNVSQNKWRPTTNNKISLPDTRMEVENGKQESKIKITTQIEGKQLECTIPCNKIVFKYIIPVLQTSNLREKEDNQPLGHVHFKIEYVGDFENHKKNVIKDLLARKQGLQTILSRVRNKEESVGDRSLIIEEHNESFRSDIKQE